MQEARDARLYPLFLKLESRTVLVIGAGPIAERKVASLLDASARVRLVAPEATAALEKLAAEGRLEWRPRPFEDADLDEAWFAIAATSDPAVQRRAARAAESRHLFLLAVDDLANASAYAAAVVERPPFTVAISSSGTAPALTRLLREVLEQVLPGPDWVKEAKSLRERWLTDGTPHPDRFAELLRAFKARASRS